MRRRLRILWAKMGPWLGPVVALLTLVIAIAAFAIALMDHQKVRAQQSVPLILVRLCVANRDIMAGERMSPAKDLTCTTIRIAQEAIPMLLQQEEGGKMPVFTTDIPILADGTTLALHSVKKGELVSGSSFFPLPPVTYPTLLFHANVFKTEGAGVSGAGAQAFWILHFSISENNTILSEYPNARSLIVEGKCYEVFADGSCLFQITSFRLLSVRREVLMQVSGEEIYSAITTAEQVEEVRDWIQLLSETMQVPVWMSDYPFIAGDLPSTPMPTIGASASPTMTTGSPTIPAATIEVTSTPPITVTPTAISTTPSTPIP